MLRQVVATAYPTVVLAPAAATLGQRIASRLPAGTEPDVRAYWLSNLGFRLAELARPAEALAATQEAVTAGLSRGAIRLGCSTARCARTRSASGRC